MSRAWPCHMLNRWRNRHRHQWTVTRVSVPMFDPSAKGELWRCSGCPKIKAK